MEAARDDLSRFDAAIAVGGSCFVLDQPVLARAFLLEAEGQAAQAGDLALAHRVAAALDALASANPAAVRLQAAARWAAGIARADVRILLEAVTLGQAAARPLDLAMMREDTAAALARDGRTDLARDLLSQALAGYDGLLARHRFAAARARLRTLGVQTGSTGRRGRPTAGWQALTDAERQVVPLVAERLSNQEIAERLFVSRRTVETHVSHTLAKLGCTTRRDLIAALRDRSRARASGSTLRPNPPGR